MLLDRAAIPKVIEILKPEAFYKESHRIMYDAMLKLFGKAVNVDITTLAEELRRLGVLEQIGGTYAVIEVTSMVPTAANVEYYARIVLERYIKRSHFRGSNGNGLCNTFSYVLLYGAQERRRSFRAWTAPPARVELQRELLDFSR
jgi:hypothetical protein